MRQKLDGQQQFHGIGAGYAHPCGIGDEGALAIADHCPQALASRRVKTCLRIGNAAGYENREPGDKGILTTRIRCSYFGQKVLDLYQSVDFNQGVISILGARQPAGIAIRRFEYLRGHAYDFMELYAPELTRKQAAASLRAKAE